RRKLLSKNILALFFLVFFSSAAFAVDGAEREEEGKTAFILHHIKDAHEWHFATVGDTHITIPLPIILYSADRGLEVFMSSKFVDPVSHERVAYNGYILDAHEHIVPEDASRTVYDFSITKNVAMLFLTIILLILVMNSVDRKSTRLNSSHVKISYAVF